MTQTILHQVLEHIKTLDTDELLQVRLAVQERLAAQEEMHKRQGFYQALLASGLVRQVKTPLRHFQAAVSPGSGQTGLTDDY